MRRIYGLLAAVLLSLVGVASAQAGVDVRVDIAAQRIQVTTTDGESYNWAISSGRKGYRTPNGVYRPTRLEPNWNAAREQILLRPALPAGAYGYQPYDLQRYYQTGPRWR